jgi:hypothetical protein
MPYQISRPAEAMLRVHMDGHIDMRQANAYFEEIWATLNGCPRPTDLLVDGRQMQSANHQARQRTEQVAHHPHLGHIAFVVSAQHLLMFAPFVWLVSGIGLFGDEEAALAYLQKERGRPAFDGSRVRRL